MLSNITYILMDEGRFCLAWVMDLCGDKTIGISVDRHMAKELVLSAPEDAIRHTQGTEDCIPHPGQGTPVLFAG